MSAAACGEALRGADSRTRTASSGPVLGEPVIAVVFRYDARDPVEFEQAHGPDGDWAGFFSQGEGYIGTELLRDVDEADRYLVIDRWQSIEAYNAFVSEHQAEYLRRSDESSFYYLQELRFGTFENIWNEPDHTAP
jgi:heme-degrading monooxygenase HmoA